MASTNRGGRASAPRARVRPRQHVRRLSRGRPSSRRSTAGAAQRGAQRRLRGLFRASMLAIAATAFILLVFGIDDDAAAMANAQDPAEQPREVEDRPEPQDGVALEAAEQAREAFEALWIGLMATLPQILVALFCLLLAWLLVRLGRPVVRRATGALEKGPAFTAMFGIVVWLLAIGVAVSVLVGDIRALLGSIGLVGLALSWALQTPIESFTGWLMNSFQGYYRVGDRIAVGEVFGDVVRIDFLTTTVWEYGGPERAPSGIAAEQPTGRMITFPNNEVLTGSIVSYTRDFPFVWDELAVPIAIESDLHYARSVIERIAHDLFAERMATPAAQYRAIIERARLPVDIVDHPQVFVHLTDSGVDLVVRYLVGARERRRWQSRLADEVITELSRSEHAGRIIPLYTRRQLQLVDAGGAPVSWPGIQESGT